MSKFNKQDVNKQIQLFRDAMRTMHIKKLAPDAIIPSKATDGSAGYDLYSYGSGSIDAGSQLLVDTKIAIAIPNEYCGFIWSRSGLSVKNGIETGAGVIDSDYRGELKVVLHNHSTTPFIFTKGTRIAQLVIAPLPKIIVNEVAEFDESKQTERGGGGFGSTGLF